MFGLSPATMVILLFIGVLLFGKDLPDVARRVGKSLLDFRRTLQGLHDEVLNDRDRAESRPTESATRRLQPPQRIAPTAQKFEDEPPPNA